MLMTCRNVRQFHDPYLDGELSPSLMAEVHAHLLQCPECQRQVEMIRASGTVIAQDRAEPVLDSGFASRVVAELKKAGPDGRSVTETRRARRRRRWRVGISASLPAAAAVLFFSVLVWPSGEPEVGPADLRPRLVLPETIEGPAQALANTKQATRDLNRLGKILVDQARLDVEQGLQEAKRPELSPWEEIIFGPFTGLLDPPTTKAPEESDGKDIVRF